MIYIIQLLHIIHTFKKKMRNIYIIYEIKKDKGGGGGNI